MSTQKDSGTVQFMLTTTDNPFDPFTQYEDWLGYDEASGYFTNEYLARVAVTSIDLSPADQEKSIELAIDEIVKENVLGIYRKVGRKV